MKKIYFNAFQHEKHFKKQLQPHSQTWSKTTKISLQIYSF